MAPGSKSGEEITYEWTFNDFSFDYDVNMRPS